MPPNVRRKGRKRPVPKREDSRPEESFDVYQSRIEPFQIAQGNEEVLSLWYSFDKQQQLELLDVGVQEVFQILVTYSFVFEEGQNLPAVITAAMYDAEFMTTVRMEFVDAVCHLNGAITRIHGPVHFAILRVLERHLYRKHIHNILSIRCCLFTIFFSYQYLPFGYWLLVSLLSVIWWTFNYPALRVRDHLFLCFDEGDPAFIELRCNDFLAGLALLMLSGSGTAWNPQVVCIIPFLLAFWQARVQAAHDIRAVGSIRKFMSYAGQLTAFAYGFSHGWAALGLAVVFHWPLVIFALQLSAFLLFTTLSGIRTLVIFGRCFPDMVHIYTGVFVCAVAYFFLDGFTWTWFLSGSFCFCLAVPAEYLRYLEPGLPVLTTILGVFIWAIVLTLQFVRISYTLLSVSPKLFWHYLQHCAQEIFSRSGGEEAKG